MEQFTNLYQLTKTLKFKLEPQGETEYAEITKIRKYCIIGTDVKNGEILLYHSSDYEEVMKVQRDITRWLQSEAFSTFEMPTADEGGDA